MIEVRVWRSRSGAPTRLVMRGHANRGPYGQDVVCAAASALVETLSLGLTDVLRYSFDGMVEEGHADLAFPGPLDVETQAVIDTICRGLQDLAASEPRAVRYHEDKA